MAKHTAQRRLTFKMPFVLAGNVNRRALGIKVLSVIQEKCIDSFPAVTSPEHRTSTMSLYPCG
jgi:hypothetical protein